MIALSGVLATAGKVQAFCRKQHWRFCFIGGVAVQRWGEPRMTQDVGLTLLMGFGSEEKLVDAWLTQFAPRGERAREMSLMRRVLLLEAKDGTGIDVAFGGLPFEERSSERASMWEWGKGKSLLTGSAEDLVIHRSFAGRDLDWGDIERILTRQYGKLDFDLIRSELKPLLALKEPPEGMDKLEQIRQRVERRLQSKKP
jgi:hypothetical protein